MSKKLAILMNAMVIPVLLSGMDVELKTLKRTGKGTNNKHDITLNLGNISEPLSAGSNGKGSIKSLKQISHLKVEQNTYRDASTGRGVSDRRQEKRNILDEASHDSILLNSDMKKGDVNGLKNRNNLTIEVPEEFGGFSSNKSFSAQDMWSIVKKANPKLYEHAKENKLSLAEVMDCPYDFEAINPQVHSLLNELSKKKSLPLNQMMEYAHLLENFNIEPEALGNLLQTHHNFDDGHTANLVKRFEDIKEKNPDKYLSLALDFITRTCDEGGVKSPSPLHETHVAIQNDMISEKRKHFWYSVIGNVATVVGFLAAGAWAIYGQVATSTHTGAPSNVPTSEPT